MKQGIKCQRILILALLSVSVLAPILFIPQNISYFASSREFLEELSGFKYTGDRLKLSTTQQETRKSLEEQTQIVYNHGDNKSVVSGDSSDDGSTASDIGNAEEDDALFERKALGVENEGGREDQFKSEIILVGGKEQKGHPSQTSTRGEPNGHLQSKRGTDVKVREIKDQLITARVYLSFAPPNIRSHLVKELKLRIKELERAAGGATKDSALSRRALQRMGSMESTLSKASQVYPDCSAMESKLHAMIHSAEEQVQAQKNHATYLIQLTARTFTKGLHCLSMLLIREYYSLQPEERELPNREKLHQPNLYHYAVFSDNILACAVVVNSTVSTAMEPEKIVFHVVTDAVNLPVMRMWFLANPPGQAAVNVESMDDFTWLPSGYSSMLKQEKSHDQRYTSRLNYLRFYLPEVFPTLDKVVLLDHDVVVQRDLRGLWSIDMKGKVNGAVELFGDDKICRHMDMFVNFSDSIAARMFDVNACTWAFGMNIFDLKEWKRQDLTSVFRRWLQLGKRRQLWKAGSLPLGLVTFYNLTVVLHHHWHLLGLGYVSGVGRGEIGRAAVIHYDGIMKPWLEIGIEKYRGYWTRFVKYDHPYLQQCNLH